MAAEFKYITPNERMQRVVSANTGADLKQAIEVLQRAAARHKPKDVPGETSHDSSFWGVFCGGCPPVLSIEDRETLYRMRRELADMIARTQPTTGE